MIPISVKIFVVRGGCIGTLLGALFACNWYLFRERSYYLPPDQRCSEKYPNYSVILDLPVVLPDGSYQSEDGNEYPVHAVWEMDRIVRGCPCTVNPCLQRCCLDSQSLAEDEDTCVRSEMRQDKQTYNTDFLPAKSSQNIYTSLNSSSLFGPVCTKVYSEINSEIHLLDDGNIWVKDFNVSYDVSDICFESQYEGYKVFSCAHHNWKEMHAEEDSWRLLRVSYNKLLLFVVVLINLVTLIVFAVLPKQPEGFGKAIFCYVLSILLRNYITLLFYWAGMLCTMFCQHRDKIATACFDITDITSRCWQIYTVYQAIKAFRHDRLSKNDHSRREFLCFSAFACGMPLTLVLLAIQLMDYQNLRIILAVGTTLVESTILMLCVTACHLRTSRTDTKDTQGESSQQSDVSETEWPVLFLNVTVFTGVYYIIVAVVNDYYNVTRTRMPEVLVEFQFNIYSLRGVEIFYVYVLKWNTLKSLKYKLLSHFYKVKENIK